MARSSVVILALESSAGQASAAVSCDGVVLGQVSHTADHGHAAWMVTLAQDVMRQSGFGFDQLSHIVAGRGPGSFTGIRVALAAAKGLALSLNIGASGLSSLSAMASQIKADDKADGRYLMTSVDSRRGSIFYQAFSPDGQPCTDIQDGMIDDIQALMAGKKEKWVLSGHATHVSADNGEGFWGDHVMLIDSNAPEATGLLSHYHAMTKASPTAKPSFKDLEPLYLSAPLLGPRS